MSAFYSDIPTGVISQNEIFWLKTGAYEYPFRQYGNATAFVRIEGVGNSTHATAFEALGSLRGFPLGTGHLLTNEPIESIGGGYYKIGREYAIIDSGTPWDVPTRYTYTYPGFYRQRDPLTRTVPARTQHSLYYTSDPTTIPETRQQRYILSGGLDVSYLTANTVPSINTYNTWTGADGGTWIIAEDSYVEPYRNNLYFRLVPYVAAK
ncbi:MAG: hypothetical protein Q7S40_03495 [Opitutaceae bacterium]|nr:hypothetical protein [Opitutaceae bacterium]